MHYFLWIIMERFKGNCF